MLFVDALTSALREELERNPKLVLLGEDIGRNGGVFRVTQGLQARFGAERVVDTPVSEAGIVGSAVGLCLAQMRPVCEIQFDAFSYPALNQIITHVGRYRWRTRGTAPMPMVIRMPCGGGVRAPELHSDSPEAYFCHTPGLTVVMPSTPADAKGLLTAAMRSPDPVIFLEPKKLYRHLRGEVPDGEHVTPLGVVRTVREGGDVTLIAWGAMVEVATATADALGQEGISAHVCDVRTLSPLDEEGLLSAARATGRVVIIQEAPRTCGVASEIAALLAEHAMYDLKAPIQRVTGFDVPHPYFSIEHHHRPDSARVLAAVHATLEA
ncbi:alpha-ketoacid dehydrogenase subunit beta [Myxococcus sp. RHSTA-1-4]|uniref:alpha-ketoacid dehydrogenase subunit beta n=1 Tax=Myxococcus sp. RHSTA-1-4 TaxID=2874601 RepID=UPI001CEC844F|nr:alpha-ketoacid dehydrogenase subunit beta [Myxococcus sp. RHSTA-1-4]MBZ4422811.1 alpha-ketoacid dehydrogenase subunit beta [Myxococcus sp. RHSTA-1-4]